jgi:hypothetical protein
MYNIFPSDVGTIEIGVVYSDFYGWYIVDGAPEPVANVVRTSASYKTCTFA